MKNMIDLRDLSMKAMRMVLNPSNKEEIRQLLQKWEESKDNTEWLDNIDMTD